MQKARCGVTAAALLAACGGGTASSQPSEETIAGTISVGDAFSVSADGSDIYVLTLGSAEVAGGAATTLAIVATRFRASQTDTFTLAADWSDFAASPAFKLAPAKTAVVQGGVAYFLGFYGVTVVPIDGGNSQIFEESPAMDIPLYSFGVGGGFVYACDSNLTTNSTNFGRFDAGGSWHLLYAGTLPASDETCFFGAVAVDTDAVYWSTSRAIRAYDLADGSVRTVVTLQAPDEAPTFLTISGDSLVWYDDLDTAFHAVNKTAVTDGTAMALGASTIARLGGQDLAPFSMVATDTNVYWLTPLDLHRVPAAGGDEEVLAQTASPNLYLGLATTNGNLYFAEDTGLGDGGLGSVTLRTRPQ